jgi:Na+/H+ antiporter NhaD/arsenite permease-like protein
MLYVVMITFVIGYIAIVFEHPLKLDKTVPALIMAAACWTLLELWNLPVYDHHGQLILEEANNLSEQSFFGHQNECNDRASVLIYHIGRITEILIFLIGAMTIVELIDMHGGFATITDRIKATKKRRMLWIVAALAFFLSAILDNLACTIVLVSLLRRLIPEKKERIYFISLAIIVANAGGAWSPIGDVTTTMLWIGNRVSTEGLVTTLLLPSIVCALIPTLIMSQMSYMNGNISLSSDGTRAEAAHKKAPGANSMLIVGLLGLVFVPIFELLTNLPPYIGMMLALGVVWLVSEYLHPEEKFANKHQYSALQALSRIEMSSVLFFLGILLAVSALEALGIWSSLAKSLDVVFPSVKGYLLGIGGADFVILIMGISSAIIDNVPLVAAAMGMYSLDEYLMDTKLWHFLAYAAGTAGSILIIGSAAGAAVMGMEKIDFIWYLRNIAWMALIGFIAGAVVFLLWYPLVG